MENEVLFSKYYTNILKGFAIILIVINHLGDVFNISLTKPLGSIGVCLFLILSGYGVNESHKFNGNKKYFIKRFTRVVMPYWVILIIYFIITKTFSIKYFLLLGLPTPMFWYLRMIVLWYLIFYISTYIKKINLKFIFIMLMSILISVCFINNRLYVWQIFSFPLGVYLSTYKDNAISFTIKKANYIGIISFIASIIFVFLKKSNCVEARTYGALDTSLQILLSISMAIFISIITYKIIKLNLLNIIDVIGEKSYEMYLIHPFLLFLVKNNKTLISVVIFLIILLLLSFSFNYINSKTSKIILKK